MSSAGCLAPPQKNAKKMRNTALTLHVLETVLTQYLLPECTWDCVEECVGWCREVVVDPAPLRRIGREWMERARGMRTLLEALFVRSDPGKFCCGSEGVPHALAILLGEIVERDQLWRAEVRAQDPGIVFMGLLDVPVHIWWVSECTGGAGRMVRRDIEKELPAWCSVVNPGVEEAYFQLWRDLNMLYERLSLPWKLLQCPEVRRPIRAVVDSLYYDIDSLWRIRRGNIQNCDGLPYEEQVEAYVGGGLEPYLGRRTPAMRLDYNSWDTRVEGMDDDLLDFFEHPREKRPRKLYRKHCTWRELSILNRECSVDGIPWAME